MEGPSEPIDIICPSAADTHALGRRIGQAIASGVILTLRGDLGSGKTTFVQGLAGGLGVPASYYVTSPTYTIINGYPGRLPLYHIDLYRLGSPEELEDIGFYDLLQPEAVVAIEWPELAVEKLPPDHLSLVFEILDNDARKIRLRSYGLQGRSVIDRLDRPEGDGADEHPIR
jgi:tRNA threonylcarbamoyladenosine biosynthesis protein TsaE